jgi:prepilin-type processing-associated H-X9-DG protein
MSHRTQRWAILSLLIVAAAVPATGAEEPVAVNGMARFVPADSLLFLSYDGNNAACRKTALYEMMTMPEMKAAFAGPLAEVRKFLARHALQEGVPGPDIVLPLVNTRIAVAAVGLQPPAEQGGEPQPQILVVVEVGKPDSPAAKAVGLLLDKAKTGMGLPPDAFKDANIAGHKAKSATVGPVEVSYATTNDGYFVLGSCGALNLALDKMTAKLSANLEFKRASELTGGNEIFLLHYAHGTVMQKFGFFLLQNQELRRVLTGPGFGLQNVRSLTLSVAADNRGFRSQLYVRAPGELQGLLKIGAAQPLDETVLKLAPQSCTFFAARSCNVGELWDFIVNQVSLANPRAGREYEEAMNEFREVVGIDLRNDFIGSLGTDFAVFGSPFGVVVEVKNKQKFERSLTALLSALAKIVAEEERDLRGAKLTLDTLEYAGKTITYVKGEQFPMFVQPCYTLFGDHAVLSMYPAALKSYLLRMKAGKTILDNPDFAAARGRVGKAPAALFYSDTRGFVDGVYTFLPLLVGVGKMVPPEFQPLIPDPAKLPPAEALSQRLYGCSAAIRKVKDGLVVECHSPVLIPTPPQMQLQGGVGTSAILAGMLLPALGKARGEARKVKSMSNLAQMGKGVNLWLLKHGDNTNYPPSLKSLVEGKIILDPRVFIHPNSGTTPQPGRFVSDYECVLDQIGKPVPEGQVPMWLPLAWEKRAYQGPGRNVVFFDGHVEYVHPRKFVELMRKSRDWAAKLKKELK